MVSMTGYGAGSAQRDGRDVSVELKSVNHRYLDIGLRLPRFLSFLENGLRQQITERVSRGHVDVFVNYANNRDDAKQVVPDEALFEAYVAAMQAMAEKSGLSQQISIAEALRMPDVFSVRQAEEDRDAVAGLCAAACEAALEQMQSMRAAEGQKLGEDIRRRLEAVADMVEEIAARAPEVPREYKARLEQRMRELLEGVGGLDEGRMVAEAALFADRCNIDEELVRLKSHIAQFGGILTQSQAIGKKLDFTLQEMNRETNTIGSKANDAAITNVVVKIKCELEKMREQVQNIE